MPIAEPVNGSSSRTAGSSSKAIIYPLFNLLVVKIILIFGGVLVAAMVFSLPHAAEVCTAMCGLLGAAYAVAVKVPEIRNLAETSAFPMALAVSYFSALTLGVLGALIVLFARLNTMNLSVFGYSNWKAVLVRWGAYVLWSMQFLYASSSGNSHGRIHLVTAAIKSHHWALLWFSTSLYVASLGVTVLLFCEFRYLLARGRE